MQGASDLKTITHDTDHRMQRNYFMTSTPHGQVLIDKTNQGASSLWKINPDGSIQNHQGKYLGLSDQQRDQVSVYAALSDTKTCFTFSEGMLRLKDDKYFLVAHRFYAEDKVGNQTTRLSFHNSEQEGHLWKI